MVTDNYYYLTIYFKVILEEEKEKEKDKNIKKTILLQIIERQIAHQ